MSNNNTKKTTEQKIQDARMAAKVALLILERASLAK